jgi:hypothetical protein
METDRKWIPAGAVIGFVSAAGARGLVPARLRASAKRGGARRRLIHAFLQGRSPPHVLGQQEHVSLAVGLLEAEGRLSLGDPSRASFPNICRKNPDPRLCA